MPGPDLGTTPFSAPPNPRSRVHASVPTLYKLNVFSTRTFFLITKLLPGIILVLIKPYAEIDVHNAIMAVRDGMSVKRAARTWHIPRSTLQSRLAGCQSHKVAADPIRVLSNHQEDQLAIFLVNQSSLGHTLTR